MPRISPVARSLSVVSVPEDVAKDIEQTYEYLQENPGFAFIAQDFKDKAELDLWRKQVDSYLATREAGILKFQKIRSDDLPNTAIKFTLVPLSEWKARGRAPKTTETTPE
jgi:hypothetical protein